MSATLTMAPSVRLHISLNVNDLKRSVAFYRILLGCEPAKVRTDYAKFEPDDPALVLSLEPTSHQGGGPLNHMGVRLQDSETLVAMQERLGRAGIQSQREEGVECCYALQTKFWTRDPDGTLWEIYTLDGDLEHRGQGQTVEQMVGSNPTPEFESLTTWQHRLGSPIPERIPHGDNEVDEILLQGSFNMPVEDTDATRLVAEAYRVLKPSGRLNVRVLTADTVEGVSGPTLPGPAAVVSFAPNQTDMLALVGAAGFQSVEMLKYDARPCFQVDGVDYRELRLSGVKPSEDEKSLLVLYKGPFAELRDDSGVSFRRGEWTPVSENVARTIQERTPEQFVVVVD